MATVSSGCQAAGWYGPDSPSSLPSTKNSYGTFCCSLVALVYALAS